jgi:2,3-bisphosphoglycerate-dependent phosphoglycerate mutase
MQTMQLYYIRHAQSANNLLWAQTGSFDSRDADPDLSSTGHQQAERLAQFLQDPYPAVTALDTPPWDSQNVAGFGLSHLYCSLMIRAALTGTILAQALDLPLVAWPDIHEMGGIYQRDSETEERIGLPGKDRAYFEDHFPDLVLPSSLGDEGWWNRPYEERHERLPRAQRFLAELLERHGATDDRVAIVSHGGFYNAFLRALLKIPEELSGWFSLNNAAITRVDFEEGELAIQYMNRVDYLPGELIT